MGVIRLKEIPEVYGKILSATVSREADRWYVSLCCEVEIEDPALVQGETVGIGLGLTSFLAVSDGTKIDAQKPLEKRVR